MINHKLLSLRAIIAYKTILNKKHINIDFFPKPLLLNIFAINNSLMYSAKFVFNVFKN